MIISVCIGSSCHLKGSYDVIKKFERIIEENNLSKEIKLCGAFCLGKCGPKVTVKINDDFYFLSANDDLKTIIDEKLKEE